MDGQQAVSVLIGFDDGYVAAGEGGTAAHFSADGISWEANSLAEMIVQPCPQSPVDYSVAEAYVTTGATDGDAVLLAGGALSFTAETCANLNEGFGSGVVTWLSTDGRHWMRSELFGHRYSVVSSLWETGGSWMAALSSWDRPVEIWKSSDALTWQLVRSIAGSQGTGWGPPLESPDGTWLVSAYSGVRVSGDGNVWRALDAPFHSDGSVSHRIALFRNGTSWTWLVVADELAGSTTWTSADLQDWDRQRFPDEIFVRWATTYHGFLVSGSACSPFVADAPCPESERQYVSANGLDWLSLSPDIGRVRVADGPAGVVAVESFGGSIWLLTD